MEVNTATIARTETWLKQHERIILALIAGIVLWFGVGKIDTLIANHDAANLQQAKVVAQAQADKTNALAAQVAQQAAQYQALADKVQAQNAQLVQANTELSVALARQQKTDASLPPTELAGRWKALVPNAAVSITNGQAILPQSGAVATVQELERVPVMQAQLAGVNTELSNTQSLVTAEGQQVATLNAEVGSLRLQQIDDAKVCSTQIATVRAQARQSKRRWFYAGMVVGFLGRQLIKAQTGW